MLLTYIPITFSNYKKNKIKNKKKIIIIMAAQFCPDHSSLLSKTKDTVR